MTELVPPQPIEDVLVPVVRLRTDVSARLVQSVGTDSSVVAAARVSTQGASDEAFETAEGPGLIRYLMANRHGTPFEHNSMTFLVEAPIFVFREFHRHRVGWSYNETSGRYKVLEPEFHIPSPHRKLIQVGKPGHYRFEEGDAAQFERQVSRQVRVYREAYQAYLDALADGVAKEVARAVLPVATFSSMYATCNARSLMHFLSLRTTDEGSKFPSFPMAEIEEVARQMEAEFSTLFPVVHEAFVEYGRCAP